MNKERKELTKCKEICKEIQNEARGYGMTKQYIKDVL